MKCTEEINKTYILELTEEEACALQTICKNPIPGDLQVHNRCRASIDMAISVARQGPNVCREPTSAEKYAMVRDTFIGEGPKVCCEPTSEKLRDVAP